MGLAKLIRFLVVKLTHPYLNPRFDIYIIFTVNYFLVISDVPVDSETLLVTDFINLKIKLTQSFICAHRDRMYVHVFIRMSAHMYMNIYIYTVFLKKISLNKHNNT
jgi:hypothetical protein